jgi:hypothetical protein
VGPICHPHSSLLSLSILSLLSLRPMERGQRRLVEAGNGRGGAAGRRSRAGSGRCSGEAGCGGATWRPGRGNGGASLGDGGRAPVGPVR